MNGKFFLDTNAIIQLLKGNSAISDILKDSAYIACSVISELEYLSFKDLSENDKLLLQKFLSRISVIGLTHDNSVLKEQIIDIRKTKKVKLPDAIILASAKNKNCQLVTADTRLLKLKDFADIISYPPIT